MFSSVWLSKYVLVQCRPTLVEVPLTRWSWSESILAGILVETERKRLSGITEMSGTSGSLEFNQAHRRRIESLARWTPRILKTTGEIHSFEHLVVKHFVLHLKTPLAKKRKGKTMKGCVIVFKKVSKNRDDYWKNITVHSNKRGLGKRLISADSYNLRAGKKYKNKSHPRKNKRFGRLKKLPDDPRGQVHPQSLCKPTPPPRCWVFLDLAATSSPSMPPQPGIGLLITHPTLLWRYLSLNFVTNLFNAKILLSALEEDR